MIINKKGENNVPETSPEKHQKRRRRDSLIRQILQEVSSAPNPQSRMEDIALDADLTVKGVDLLVIYFITDTSA